MKQLFPKIVYFLVLKLQLFAVGSLKASRTSTPISWLRLILLQPGRGFHFSFMTKTIFERTQGVRCVQTYTGQQFFELELKQTKYLRSSQSVPYRGSKIYSTNEAKPGSTTFFGLHESLHSLNKPESGWYQILVWTGLFTRILNEHMSAPKIRMSQNLDYRWFRSALLFSKWSEWIFSYAKVFWIYIFISLFERGPQSE